MTKRYVEINGQRVEIRRNITPREYSILSFQTDRSRMPVCKLRRCFVYKDHYFQLDYFNSPNRGLVLLEAYLDKEGHGELDLPDWLDCIDVTDDPQYSMYEMSIRPESHSSSIFPDCKIL
jgi:CYTH domain-containing protein